MNTPTPQGVPEGCTAPKKIYLQWYGDGEPVDGEPPAGAEITWCKDSIFDHDVEYVRADLVPSAVATATEPIRVAAFENTPLAKESGNLSELLKQLPEVDEEHFRFHPSVTRQKVVQWLAEDGWRTVQGQESDFLLWCLGKILDAGQWSLFKEKERYYAFSESRFSPIYVKNKGTLGEAILSAYISWKRAVKEGV